MWVPRVTSTFHLCTSSTTNQCPCWCRIKKRTPMILQTSWQKYTYIANTDNMWFSHSTPTAFRTRAKHQFIGQHNRAFAVEDRNNTKVEKKQDIMEGKERRKGVGTRTARQKLYITEQKIQAGTAHYYYYMISQYSWLLYQQLVVTYHWSHSRSVFEYYLWPKPPKNPPPPPSCSPLLKRPTKYRNPPH